MRSVRKPTSGRVRPSFSCGPGAFRPAFQPISAAPCGLLAAQLGLAAHAGVDPGVVPVMGGSILIGAAEALRPDHGQDLGGEVGGERHAALSARRRRTAR